MSCHYHAQLLNQLGGVNLLTGLGVGVGKQFRAQMTENKLLMCTSPEADADPSLNDITRTPSTIPRITIHKTRGW